jgi:subfamily B ATP-binding cassette protein MsbA
VLGGYEILHGRLEGGATGLMKFLFLLQGAGAEVNSVARLWVVLQQAEAAARRTLELLAESATVADAPDAVELEQVDGRVTFDNVDFAYDGSNRVLEGVSVDIRPGEVVALAGRSGAGKTTIANLVPRLYDVQSGAVLVDGLDVRRVKQASLKRFMGMVPQETILFGTSVRENIGFGREGATEEEIIAAAQAANAHDFIMALPEGYDTQVGERGTRLSGGQRQRVAIARAFLRNPRILILDEATSSLDTESEKAIHASLKSLLQGRTALIIAHRLSTIRDADRIVVVDGGRICEQGTHDSLLAQGGLYRRLYESRELALDEPAAAEDGVAGPGVPA